MEIIRKKKIENHPVRIVASGFRVHATATCHHMHTYEMK